jgi:hypothetical protein
MADWRQYDADFLIFYFDYFLTGLRGKTSTVRDLLARSVSSPRYPGSIRTSVSCLSRYCLSAEAEVAAPRLVFLNVYASVPWNSIIWIFRLPLAHT